MLTTNERLLKIATADMRTLARVDAVLTGEDAATAAFEDRDTRTCTLTDAARRLGVSRPTVYELLRNGRLDAVALNGARRVTVRSIDEFASGARTPDAETVERMRATSERNRAIARAAIAARKSNHVEG